MARPKRSICVRCDSCDQLHMAHFDRARAGALGPVDSYVADCPVTGVRMDYTADEEVQLP